MSLFDNEVFTIYRDADLEAFYDVDLKNRRKIILAHAIIYFFPVLMAILFTRLFSLDDFAVWLIVFALMLYAIVIVETTSYLFPKSREFYKKYFLWIVIPIGFLIGLGGYSVGQELFSYVQDDEVDLRTTFRQIILGGLGVFALFFLSQFGMSQILYASRSLYTRKAEVEADIRFATEVQERILMDVSIDRDDVRAYACSYPANDLGGDYFELSLRDDHLFASIGDISGHSFGAGLLMTMSKSALQTHLGYTHDPAKVLSALNNMLNRQSGREMFATMVLLRLDIPKRRVTLSNAGHLPVLHIPAGSSEVIRRHVKGVGLGIITSARYSNLEFDVQPGDLLVIYSDGLAETRDENMQVRDMDFFVDTVAGTITSGAITSDTITSGTRSPRDLAITLMDKIRGSDHAREMEDDSTLIIIEIN